MSQGLRGGSSSARERGREMAKAAAAAVEQLRSAVSQLSAEAALNRLPISKSAKELLDFCQTEKPHDGLVTGIPDSQNPFQVRLCLLPPLDQLSSPFLSGKEVLRSPLSSHKPITSPSFFHLIHPPQTLISDIIIMNN